ncbi:MAG: choice-of-anchor I family protein [Pirellulaceae bacterium]|nr:choice-of-anchor I family protein [Pirellulaceae bacterium]
MIPTIGAQFRNDNAGSITQLNIAYRGEQWRLGTAGRAVLDRLDFQFSTDATSLTTGSWTDFDALDFAGPSNATPTGAKDGNASGFNTALNSSITGLSILPSGTFWIRWNDFDASGADDGLAVDDFSITAVTGVPAASLVVTQSGGSTSVTEGGNNDSFTVALNRNPDANVTVTLTPANNQVDLGNGAGVARVLTFTSANGTTSQTVTVSAMDDAIVEGNQAVAITISTTSTDAAFNALTTPDVNVTVIDNDFVGLIPPQANDFATVAGPAGLGLGWTVQSVDTDTANTWFAATVDGNRLAEANGFGDTAPANDWLISPPINLDTTTGEVVRFDTFTRFTDSGATPPALRFRYSTNYSGLGDPTAATWTDLSFTVPSITDPLTSSGNIDVSGIAGTLVWFAFQYTSSGTTGSTSTQWRVDNFSIQPGTAAPAFTIAATDANKLEGNSGTTPFTFTVIRSGNTTGADTVDFAVTSAATDGATAPDFAGAALPAGTVSFADGEVSKVITINVAGDTVQEANEGFIVTLSNASRSGTLTTATATGTIRDDDAPAPTVWINEIHYDNIGTDAGEFIELAGTAGANLTGWSIVLYNGSNGATYGTAISPTVTIDNEGSGFGAVDFQLPVDGLQNGAPDGVALVNNLGVVVEFLSYEGSFAATNGPANGMTSTDIGVAESNATTPVGFSLQRKNTVPGTPGVWGGPFDDSPGSLNVFPAPAFSIAATDGAKPEGNSGTTTYLFTVTRGGDISLANDVNFAVTGTAVNPANAADFVGAAFPSGTLNFAAGETSKAVAIEVAGDTTVEPDEGFIVTLSNATAGAVITTAAAEGTIQNDDTAVNQPPVANDDSLSSIAEDSGVRTIAIATLIANDSDPNGDTLSITAVSNPVGGTVSISGTDVLFTPTLNFNGPASFEYTLSDGSLNDTGAVNFAVTPVNDVPLAQASSVTTTEDTAKTFAASDFLFSDVEGDSLVSITITNLNLAVGDLLTVDQGTGPTPVGANTTVSASQLASLTYRPAANASGSPRSSFQFTVNDANLGAVAASMSLNVSAVNDVPVAKNILLTAGSTTTVANGAEISAFDKATKKLFITKNDGGVPSLDVINLTNPASPGAPVNINLTAFGGSVSSVAAKDGLVVAAMIAATKTAPGTVVFISANTHTVLGSVSITSQPDMITFTPDGTKVLVAIEGEAADNAAPTVNNPEGGVAIITLNLGNLSSSEVSFAGFSSFNAQKAALIASGVRLLSNPGVSVAMDLEPEYIAVSADGTTARVTLQEANAFGVLDLVAGSFSSIQPLGMKNHSLPGNEFDASDRDAIGSNNSPVAGNLRSWPVFGLYMPDAVASFTVAGQTYYITANEGDARPNAADTADTDVLRVNAATLDPTVFPNAAFLRDNDNLGRLNVLTDGDLDGDGDLDRLISLGSRSFTIWDSAGARVFDSGSDFERITFAQTPTLFNANNGVASAVDQRSDDKGPEPEGVVTGEINGRTYAFVGLERAGGGVMVYDVTTPATPSFVQYIRKDGDISPEGIVFISAADSPNGQPLLVLSNEVSGTVTIYPIATASVTTNEDTSFTFAATNFPFIDVESDSLVSITISGLNLASGDTLRLSGVYVVVGQTITAANIANLVYTPAANANGMARSTFTYRVNDAQSGAVSATMTIDVAGINDSPVFNPANYHFQVAENSLAGTVVGTVMASDPDSGTTLTYSLSGMNASSFAINPLTGAITVASGTVLDFEGGTTTFSLIASVTDGTLAATAGVTIIVTNVNEAPSAGTIPNVVVRQGAADTVIDLKPVFSDPETSDASLVYSVSANSNAAIFTSVSIVGGVLTLDYNPAAFGTSTLTVRATDEGTLFAETSFSVTVNYTLQLLHLADAESGLLAPTTAPNLAALVDAFDDDYSQTLILAGGDNWIPGPFLAGGTDASVRSVLNTVSGSTITGTIPIAAVDIAIHNELGVEVSAIGNHEFDLGSNVFRTSFTPGSGWVGANFVHVSANLDFSGDPDLNSRFTNTLDGGVGTLIPEASTLKGRIAPSVVVTKGGQKIGIVGATTQLIESISSPSGTEVAGFPGGPGPNGETDNMDLLAAQLQPVINELRAEGINKIVLMSHLQVLSNEQSLATKLNGVDIILSAGSNTRLGDADDVPVAFPGHAANFANTYPIVTAGTDGKPTVIVNTDNEFTYLGRLVIDFNEAGEINVAGLPDLTAINGAYAATAANVAAAWAADGGLAAAFAEGTKGEEVADLTEAVQAVITAKDGNVSGFTNVYLQGERVAVRNQETNLGNLTADANTAALLNSLGAAADRTFVASLKNGGGIRAQIGTVSAPDPVTGQVNFLPPAANPAAGKPAGAVSQLDIENSLRFNNTLMAFDTTATGLKAILEHGVAVLGNQGRFPQIGGVRFSYDPTLAAGSRIRNVALIDSNDNVLEAIVVNGVVSANAPATITIVTLNFLANGGDSYPIKANGDNFRYLLNGGALSAPISESLDFTAAANVPVNALGEQTALFDFLRAQHATSGVGFNKADTPDTLDTRIQNLSRRSDAVFPAVALPTLVSVVVNGADSFLNANQRSVVTSIVVTFSAPIANPLTAFSITNIGLFAPSSIPLAVSQILVSASGSTYTLRFGSGDGVVSRLGSGGLGNSLADGNYRLSISPARVSGTNTFGTAATDRFFRMFGDSDGDGDVDGSDTLAFRRAQGTYNSALDYDGNNFVIFGTVDSIFFNANSAKRRRTF